MIYLHSTDERRRTLTEAAEKAARAEPRKARRKPAEISQPAEHRHASGTDAARDSMQES
jgi:hypothetical protein